MSILRIVRMLYSKHLLKEILVIFQIMLLVGIYNLAIIPFDSFLKSRAAVEESFLVDFDNDILFTGSLSLGEAFIEGNSEVLNNLIVPLKEKYDVLYMYEGNAVLEIDSQAIGATLNVYSEEMYNSIKFDVADDNFDDTLLQDGEIPVYISRNLSKYYNIGDKLHIRSYQEEKNEIPCRVAGILNNNSYIITVGSSDNIFTQMLYETENFIVAKYNEAYFKNSTLYPRFLIKNTAEETVNEINEAIGKYGGISTVNEFFEKIFLQTLENSEWEILILFLLVIVLVFGYGGYLIVNNMQKRKLCSIFYICGMSLGKVTAIHVLAGLLLFIPGIILGLLITPFFLQAFTNVSFADYNIYTVMLIVGIIVFCSLTAIIFSVVQTKKVAAIDLYRINE